MKYQINEEKFTFNIGGKTIFFPEKNVKEIQTLDPRGFSYFGSKDNGLTLKTLLAKNNLKLEWVKSIPGRPKYYLAGIGDEANPSFVWSMPDDIVYVAHKRITSNLLTQLKPEDQKAFLTGGEEYFDQFKVGDMVKCSDGYGYNLIGRITSITPHEGRVIRILDHSLIDDPKAFTEILMGKDVYDLTKISPEDYRAWTNQERDVASLLVDGNLPSTEGEEGNIAAKYLTSLNGCPDVVDSSLIVSRNDFTSLKGCASKVMGDFECKLTKITSLEGGPLYVGGSYDVERNSKLTSLKGAAERVEKSFIVRETPVTSLEGAPAYIGKDLDIQQTNITSLQNIHQYIKFIGGKIGCSGCKIKSHMMGVFIIKGLQEISFRAEHDDDYEFEEVLDIIHSWLPMGKAGLLKCQMELISKGFDQYAQI